MSLYDAPQGKKTPNLLLVVLLCAAVLLGSDLLTQHYLGRHLLGTPVAQTATALAPAVVATPVVAEPSAISPTIADVYVPLMNERLKGEINLRGGSLDKLTLQSYRTEITDPKGYALFGISSTATGPAGEKIVAGWQGAGVEGPSAQSQWQIESDLQTAEKVVMVWRNASGQSFQRIWQVKPNSYVWQVTERVINTAALPVTLTPYAQVVRHGAPNKAEVGSWVNYFGPMGQIKEGNALLLKEEHYADIKKAGQTQAWQGTDGWWGITSQYFAALLIPAVNEATTRQFAYRTEGNTEVYTAGMQFAPHIVAPNGGTAEVTYQLYAGPKHFPMMREVGAGLEQSISWGWFEPLVKGFYAVLTFIHGLIPNWGVAVIVLTLLLKLATYPLANTSYRAMAKMKKLQPQIEALKKQNEGNQQANALAMMKLYKDNKVNPLSGCWPMLIQIPIFFAMYKVVLLMFEFRHAPFLYMTDLATYDPTYILPLLMGASMYVQFKLNPKPTDPAQELMFKWMPLMMTVMFLWFPAGLVLYWLTNNVLSIGQQWLMMKKEKAL